MDIAEPAQDHTLNIRVVDVNAIVTTSVEKLFIWLYTGNNLLTFGEIIRLAKIYHIPDNIILSKFIIQLSRDGLDVDAIVNKLVEDKILVDYNVDQLKIMISCLRVENDQLEENLRPLTRKIYKVLVGMASKTHVMYDCHQNHDAEYPSLHEQEGRPYLNWKECYYEDCHLKFKSAETLMEHLNQVGKYTPRFHLAHENIVSYGNLSPEKILNDGLTRCPSLICNKSNVIFTPEELCEHFMKLGIKPFWYPGVYIAHPEKDQSLGSRCYEKIYINDDCGICLEQPSTTIILPCYHNVICLECSPKLDKCPMCRASITRILPF